MDLASTTDPFNSASLVSLAFFLSLVADTCSSCFLFAAAAFSATCLSYAKDRCFD
jgi:hypothetical protein